MKFLKILWQTIRFYRFVRKEVDYWGKIEPAGYVKGLTKYGNDIQVILNGDCSEPFGVVLLWYPAEKKGDKT
jgi:hypothetical protein